MVKLKCYNCKTLEDAQDFIYQCIDKDIQVWRTACWEVYKEDFCFNIDWSNKRLSYASKNFYIGNDFEIIEFHKGDKI